jgi:hypothetical protein
MPEKRWKGVHVKGVTTGGEKIVYADENARDIVVEMLNRLNVQPSECLVILSYMAPDMTTNSIVQLAIFTDKHIPSEITLNIPDKR